MRKLKGLAAWLMAVLLFFLVSSCLGPSRRKDDNRRPDNEGNLKLHSSAPLELVAYVDKAYKKTLRPGEKTQILVEGTDPMGTVVDVELFIRSMVPDLGSYPTNPDAKYFSFTKVVRPVGHPSPVVPIYIRALSESELSTKSGIDSVLVRFSYNDFPRIDSTASVFKGSVSNQIPLVRLQNGDSVEVPLPVGLHQISIEYATSGKNIQRAVYPTTITQMNDERFLVPVSVGITELQHAVPMIKDIFNIIYPTSGAMSRGILSVTNNTPFVVDIKISSGTQPETLINGNDSFVFRGRKRDFPINVGEHTIRAVDALNGGYLELAKLNDLRVDGGMKYFWYPHDNSLEEKIDVSVPQLVSYFQAWTIDSVSDAKITLQISSTAEGVHNSVKVLGQTDSRGQLLLKNLDIADMVRGLRTDNARKVNLTIIAEKQGYETQRQTISAYNLLLVGKNFRPEKFALERVKILTMEDNDFIIGEPLIN
jgi:hypothetical protein